MGMGKNWWKWFVLTKKKLEKNKTCANVGAGAITKKLKCVRKWVRNNFWGAGVRAPHSKVHRNPTCAVILIAFKVIWFKEYKLFINILFFYSAWIEFGKNICIYKNKQSSRKVSKYLVAAERAVVYSITYCTMRRSFFSGIALEFHIRLQEILFSNQKYLTVSKSKRYRISCDILADLSFKCSFLNDLWSSMIYQHFETYSVFKYVNCK